MFMACPTVKFPELRVLIWVADGPGSALKAVALGFPLVSPLVSYVSMSLVGAALTLALLLSGGLTAGGADAVPGSGL